MPELSLLEIVGGVAVAVVGIAWLVVSFRSPGAARVRVAWIATTAIYVALSTLFTGLFLRARASDSTVGTIGFGILLTLFLGGLVVSAFKTLGALRKGKPPGADATH